MLVVLTDKIASYLSKILVASTSLHNYDNNIRQAAAGYSLSSCWKIDIQILPRPM